MGKVFGVILLISLILMSTIIIINEEERKHKHHRKKLGLNAKYLLDNFKIITHMATINIPGDKTFVTGQLVPTLGGNPVDISTLQPDSDSYTSSDESVAVVAKTGFGTFTVSRANPNGGSATVTYNATATTGNSVSGSDSFVFDAAPPPPPSADSLTATFSEPQ